MRNEPLLPELELSDVKVSLVQRLRVSEQARRRVRCAILIVGSLMFAGSIIMFERIWSTVAYDQILLALCVLVAPALGIVLFVGLAGQEINYYCGWLTQSHLADELDLGDL